jgi:hypothetical protein
MNLLELERETTKMTRVMMTRNTAIGKDSIADLRSRMALEEVCGVILVSLERLLWLDWDAVVWAIAHLIPADIMAEIQSTLRMGLYQRLIHKGLIPGVDFSIDAQGHLMLNAKAQKAVA